MRTFTALAAAALATIALTGCDMTRKPKASYIDRVAKVCGPDIARDYATVGWKDRDYAQDSLLVSCIVFKDR